MPSDCVSLTADELRICDWVGRRRFGYAVNNHCDAGLGSSRGNVSPVNGIRGVECEYAASIILNLYWRPTTTLHEGRAEPDVGGLIEVRSTVLRNGRLIVKDADRDVPFVLIFKDGPTFTALGWLFADYAKSFYPLLTDFGDPAHFVPQRDLYRIDTLRGWIRATRIMQATRAAREAAE